MVNRLILEHNDQMAFHPGVYILDSLEDLEMTQRELARRVGTSEKNISEIINGIKGVTVEMAMNLSKVFQVDSQTWLNLQNKYDTLKQEIEHDKSISDQKPLLEHIDYSKLVKLGVVEKYRRAEDKIKELCRVFKISKLDALKNRDLAINFRATAVEQESHVINTNLWIEMVSLQLSTKPQLQFNKHVLEGSIDKLRSLTNEDANIFIPEVTRILEETGIHFILMPSLKNAKPKGMVMWRDGKITLAMSNKGKYADVFWFTFFHEIGHILMHPHKDFVELDGKSQREYEADEFARKILINDEDYNDFIASSNFSYSSITSFANRIGINPSIIIGRMENDKLIPYYQYANRKTKYVWSFDK